MRSSHMCPKCNRGVVLHVPEISDSNQDRMTLRTLPGCWENQFIGVFEAYICRGCGYTEFYVSKADALKLDELPGARELRAKATPPFR